MRTFLISVAAEMVPLSAHDRSAATRRGWTTSAMARSEPGRLMAARMNPRSLLAALDVDHAGEAHELRRGPADAEGAVLGGLEDELVGRWRADEDGRRAEEVRPVHAHVARAPPGVVAPPPGVDEAVGATRELVVPEQSEALAHKREAHVAWREPRTTAPALHLEEGAVADVVAVPHSEREQRNGAEEEADPPRPVHRRHLCVHRH